MTAELQIESYLTSLRLHLGSLTIAEREEIVREIEAHVRDSAEESGATVETILVRLGPAEELAAQYRDGLLIRKASRSFSPLVLLRATLRFSTRGMFGILVCFAGLFGYWLGGGLVICGFMGALWSLTHHSTESPLWVEAVGVLLFLGAGCLILLLTTFVLRSALRVFQRWQSPL